MRRLLKDMIMLGLGAIAVFYLTYPSFGWLELIPDAIPVIGSLDEATATLILINVLKYYGIDLTMFQRQQTKRRRVRGTGTGQGKSANQPEVIVQNRDSDQPPNSSRR